MAQLVQLELITLMQHVIILKFIDGLLGRAATSWLSRPGTSVVSDISSILLIRPGGIGDALLLAPTIRAIKINFPTGSLDVLAEKRNAGAFSLIPGIRRVFHYDSPGELLSIASQRYDVIIDTEQWYRLSAVMARLVRSRQKIGFATNERCRMFTNPVPYAQDCFEAESFLMLLGPLGITDDSIPTGEILKVPNDARQKAGALLAGALQQPLVALFPSASIPEKRWGLKKFRQLAEWCASHDLQVVILGGKHDRILGEQIAEGQKILNLAGLTSLSETAAVLEQAMIVVSGDSGVLHLASCLGRPTVSLFGPSNAKKWAPRGDNHIVLNKNLPCSPCTRFGTTPKCPIGARCLQEITPDEVISAVMNLLTRNSDKNFWTQIYAEKADQTLKAEG